MAMLMNAHDIESMSNEAVLEALREMATQSMQQAVDKSAAEEVFASMQKTITDSGHQDGPSQNGVPPTQIETVFPDLEVKPVELKIEREIVQEDQPKSLTPMEQKTISLDIKTADVVFDVEGKEHTWCYQLKTNFVLSFGRYRTKYKFTRKFSNRRFASSSYAWQSKRSLQ